MLTLKLFGPPALEAGGRRVVGRAAQGHRLALLAVLALSRGRPVTRDRLTALLWPESPAERARPQLSDAVYILRTALGEDVIRSAGDDVALNDDAVATDVGAYERLLDEGRPEEAVALFAGPLLEGFHLADGGELERWLDAERARLAGRHAAALEALAEASEARGDLAAAERWWRRRAAQDPYSGRVAVRLMRALEAAGDRAGALRHARIHGALLREEFGADPDPEVAALAERLRVAPAARAPAALPGSEAGVGESPAKGPPAAPASAAGAPAAPAESDADAAPERPAAGMPPPSHPPPPPRRRRWAWRRAVGVVAAALLVVAVGWRVGVSRERGARPPAAAGRSLAVLPFVNMSADPRNAYFSDGLSEQIITALSHVEGLRVAARTSSFALRGDALDVRVIGDTLGVETVLEGSVRREGSRLRVTAQLIDAESGYHIWSGEYDREVADVIAVQDEIARAIAGALEMRLPPRTALAQARPAPDLAAYDLYLRALQLRNALGADALRQATELLDRAIELEPRFALAWAAKASVLGPRIHFRQMPRDRGVAELRGATERALALDPQLGEAHVALGILKLFYEWDWPAAERALREAVRLNPSDAHAWHHLANYHAAMGRFDDALAARARGVALDPLNARTRIVYATDLARVGRFDDAVRHYERARASDPVNPLLLGQGPGLPIAAAVYLAQGRPADAVQEMLRVAALRGATVGEIEAMRAAFAASGVQGFWRRWLDMDLRQSGPDPDPLRVAMLWAAIGEDERALDWLERALKERNGGLIYVPAGRGFAGLRSHPRFSRIAAEMRIPAR